MAPLRDSFEDDHDDDAPPPGPLVRPMGGNDAWEMVALVKFYYEPDMNGENFMEMKRLFESMIPYGLVAVKPGGAIIGFGFSIPGPEMFTNKRGVVKIVTHPDEDRMECTKKIIRGFARQTMAEGGTTLEVSVPDGDDVVEDACSDYGAVCTKRIDHNSEFGPVKALIFTIKNLSEHFGYGADKKPPKPKDPKP